MPSVTSTIKRPDGTAYTSGRVVIELAGESGRPVRGWVDAATDYAMFTSYTIESLTAGAWTQDLVANSLISPAGTRWKITEQVDGRSDVYYIEVPDGAGPYQARTIEDDPPGTIASSALTTHETDPAAHGTDYENVQALGNSGAAKTITAVDGTYVTLTLTANCTLTFPSPTTGYAFSFTLEATQDATGGRTITWPASVKWPAGVPPTLTSTASKMDILAFVTRDGGTTWRGFTSGQNFTP